MNGPGPLYEELHAKFGQAVRDGRQDPPFEVVTADRRRLPDVVRYLGEYCGFESLMDLTAVDYLGFSGAGAPKERFELVYHLLSFSRHRRLRLKVGVPDTDPSVPSLAGIWSSANWLEREVWDMFGIRFTGHPDLRRILMYGEFVGHPLRKDYPLGKQQPRVAQLHPGVPPFGKKPLALREGEE